MTNRRFITATGTDIGKTYVMCQLCETLRQAGKTVHALKPVISGWDESSQTDTAKILQSLGLVRNQKNIDRVSPWRFAAPLSPDMAAKQENTELSYSEILDFCQQSCDVDELLIEGVGGVMVPLTASKTILDLMVDLGCPVILVAGSYLGTMSHTLTAVRVLQQAGVPIESVIISESPDSHVNIPEMCDSLRSHMSVPLTVMPRV